jgi:methionine-rich copper-binding protein CopC
MTPAIRDQRRRAGACFAAVLVAMFAMPVVAVAHAELESASPPDRAVLSAPPEEIVLTFTEALDPVKSHMELISPVGSQVAAGGVDPDNENAMRIDPPELAPGTYEIRSTAVAAHDGALKREQLTFRIEAPSPSPSSTPAAPSASAAASASPSASASAPPSAAPSPAPSAGGDATASGTDVILPILAALAVVLLLGTTLLRGRSRGGGGA